MEPDSISLKNEYFEILGKYVDEVIKPSFGIEHAGLSSYSKVDDSDEFTGTISLPTKFSEYKNTDYYFKDEDKKFIHFTSLNTFIKIIDSGYFFANQLTYHDDPLELIYAGKEILDVISIEQLNELKKYLYSLSMCIFDDEKSIAAFNMWRLYGDGGNGIGIVFSFCSNKDNWKNTFLSSIYYGNKDKGLDKFRRFSEAHKIFMDKYPMFKMKPYSFAKENIPNDIGLFLALHKNSIFDGEEEVRFLKSFLNDDKNCDVRNKSIGLTIDKKNNLHKTYKIPIVSEKNIKRVAFENGNTQITGFQNKFFKDINSINEYINDAPFIIIEKVILGYRYNDEDLSRIKKKIAAMVNEKVNNGRNIEFELSNLSHRFHDFSKA